MVFYHQVSFVLANHLIAGFIAAFIAFPLAFFSKKGSLLHVTAGRVFVLSFLIICISGYHMDADEIFNIPLIKTSLCKLHSYQFCSSDTLTNKIHDRILITVCINTFALYLCLSGWRLANQHRRGRLTKKTAGFNACFAGLECLMVLLFAVAEGYNYSLLHQLYDVAALKYYAVVGAIALIPLLDAARDLYFALMKKIPPCWWKMHLRKMLMAEYGLIVAFVFRCEKTQGHWLIAAITLLFFIFYLTSMSLTALTLSQRQS